MAVNKLLLSDVFQILYRKHCDCTFPVIIVVTATSVLHSYLVQISVCQLSLFFRLVADSQDKRFKARLGIAIFIFFVVYPT